MQMKRLSAVALAVLLGTLVGCGSDDAASNDSGSGADIEVTDDQKKAIEDAMKDVDLDEAEKALENMDDETLEGLTGMASECIDAGMVMSSMYADASGFSEDAVNKAKESLPDDLVADLEMLAEMTTNMMNAESLDDIEQTQELEDATNRVDEWMTENCNTEGAG